MDANKTVTAVFVPSQQQYTLTVNVLPTEADSAGCTVTKVPDEALYTCGSSVQLTANEATCWIFDHWTGEEIDGSTANPENLTMDANKTVTAHFIEENIITFFELEGWQNAGCSPGFGSPHQDYHHIDPDPEIYDVSATVPYEIKPGMPWLKVTTPNLKSVHFFINIADDSTAVSYRYTTSIIREDVPGFIVPIEALWEWSDPSEIGILTGPDIYGEYVFSSTCIEIPGTPPSDYPHHFYIEITIGKGTNANTYMVHVW